MEPGSAVWIMKPSLTNQGAGISVIDSCAGLRAALEAAPDLREWVVQRYIERPLLAQGRKFHIRAYALCVGEVGAKIEIVLGPAAKFRSGPVVLCLSHPTVQAYEAASRCSGLIAYMPAHILCRLSMRSHLI